MMRNPTVLPNCMPQVCSRAQALAKQFRHSLPNASQEDLVVLTKLQLREEFAALLKEIPIADYLKLDNS